MKQSIIDKMVAELNDTRYCKSDFEYDLRALNGYDEPFFWMVRKNGTSLCIIGVTQLIGWSKSQKKRFQLFRDKNCAISDILYWNEPAKYFYYDGFELVSVTKEDIPEIFNSVFDKFYENMKAEYSHEYAMCNEPLEIQYVSESTENRMNETLRFAEDMSDNSLKECVERLTKYDRCSTDHYISIYTDFAKHSFGWSEVVNGKCRMNGGIIYHNDKSDNHWQIHT